jgi:hypothetical protein
MKTISNSVQTHIQMSRRPYIIIDDNFQIESVNESLVDFLTSNDFETRSCCDNIDQCPLLNNHTDKSKSECKRLNNCVLFKNQPLDMEKMGDLFESGHTYIEEDINLWGFSEKNVYLMAHKLAPERVGILLHQR